MGAGELVDDGCVREGELLGYDVGRGTVRMPGYSCRAADSKVERTTAGSSQYDGTRTDREGREPVMKASISARGTRTCLRDRYRAP